jgi:spermidine synthase
LKPWKLLDSTRVPGSDNEMRLYQRDTELSIRVDGAELMNSRASASENALAELGCARIRERRGARVLIGGLGMGFSLRTALDALQPDAQVIVSELVPAVVRWNRDHLGELANHPLRDPRVSVEELDVAKLIRSAQGDLDAILLDVDNGPEGLTRSENDKLYARAGLLAARAALRAGGVLGIWSAAENSAFVQRLRDAAFEVDQISRRGRGMGKGPRHTIWLATPNADSG